jgi:hypothetical protein
MNHLSINQSRRIVQKEYFPSKTWGVAPAPHSLFCPDTKKETKKVRAAPASLETSMFYYKTFKVKTSKVLKSFIGVGIYYMRVPQINKELLLFTREKLRLPAKIF